MPSSVMEYTGWALAWEYVVATQCSVDHHDDRPSDHLFGPLFSSLRLSRRRLRFLKESLKSKYLRFEEDSM